ncbi:MAG: 23S rRNA (guanosine(2251)-2'-O)-methyltransferase RlmB [Candidatus Omnitrophota bacterium]
MKKKKKKNAMYLYGKNSVFERLQSNSKSIKNIYVHNTFDVPQIVNRIESCNIPLHRVNERELEKIKRADRLQGIVARVDTFTYTPFESIIRSKKTCLCIDNINDPHNLGSIIRIAACFGDFAIVIPMHNSCEVNDTVMHVASGGENHVPVAQVTNMSTALIQAKKAGYWIAGTVVENGKEVNAVTFPFPLCLVLGSEGKGIRYGIKNHLDLSVTLPMGGAQLSFNVAMACAIFCYEISKQKH